MSSYLQQYRERIRGYMYAVEGKDVDECSDTELIERFNDWSEQNDAPVWLCPDCHNIHSKWQSRCDLPCVQAEHSKQITEDEIDQLYQFYDPADPKMDYAFLRYPHTKFRKWMEKAQEVYRIKKEELLDSKLCRACELFGVKEININDLSKPMTPLELGLRKFEIQRYRGKRTYFKDLEALLDFYIEEGEKNASSE